MLTEKDRVELGVNITSVQINSCVDNMQKLLKELSYTVSLIELLRNRFQGLTIKIEGGE